MNKDILRVAQMVANEKSVDAFTVTEAALTAITANKLANEANVRVTINRRTGDFETFRRWTIIADEDQVIKNPANQLLLSEALLHNPNLKVGDLFEERIDSIDFSRVDAHLARETIGRAIRNAMHANAAKAYLARIGEVLIGMVRRVTREGIILDLADNNVEAFLPREEMIPREEIRPRDRLSIYLYEVLQKARGPQLLVSRSSPQLLAALFKRQISEVEAEVIKIKGVARDPGARAKVAVKTNDGQIDPIGTCIGIRGERVQAISSEINGEHIDIILWDDNPAQLAINALAPAKVSEIIMDEDAHTMDVIVQTPDLARAIGRNGQNVRLASALVGWTLNIMTEEDSEKKAIDDARKLQIFFKEQLEIEESLAEFLVKEGFSALEEIAYIPQQDLISLSTLSLNQFETLRNRAKDRLLTQALAEEIQIQATSQKPQKKSESQQEALTTVEGMHEALLIELAAHGIHSREALAELSIDDLLEITSLDREQAGQLIMAARAYWFK
jgi:transcription termination/antitermination protein NusA